MNKVYKIRLYPNEIQQELIEKTFGCVRFLYNRMLEDGIKHHEMTGQKLYISSAKYKNEHSWLEEVDGYALTNAQLSLERDFQRFIRNPENGVPAFKSKKKERQSYITNLADLRITDESKFLRLPKVGWVRIEGLSQVPDNHKIKMVKVIKNASGLYLASISFGAKNKIMSALQLI